MGVRPKWARAPADKPVRVGLDCELRFLTYRFLH